MTTEDTIMAEIEALAELQKANALAIAANSKAIAELAEKLTELAEQTKGAVTLYTDLTTAIRIGSGMQKLGKWIITWPLVGVGILAIVDWWSK